MGFSGIVAQVLLLRELLVTFYGNELSIGIILANWLILEAAGSFLLGKKVERLKRRLRGFVVLSLLFSLSFPLAIYATRILKVLIGVTPGKGLGMLPILYSSFFILLPVSISHGALFTFGCKLHSLYSSANAGWRGGPPRLPAVAGRADTLGGKQEASSIGKVYIYETLGAIAGGIILTYLLVPYIHSLQIALGVALLNFALCAFLLIPSHHLQQNTQTLTDKILAGASLLLFFLTAFLIFGGGADKLHRLSIKQQWKGQKLVDYKNSIYGNVAVTKRGEQYTFFSDGIPIITTPTPDISFVEEFVHLPMLFSPRPERVLILSGGAGGVINEVLKHSQVERVDYAELDPLLLKAVKKFPTSLTRTELGDPRVNIEYVDGRRFVKRTSRKYDLVLVGLSEPSDLQTNRFFTKEFFSEVLNRLNKEGILVIGLPGSLTYLSEELKNLNACILNTIESIYPYVRIIPGDGTNLYLASASKEISLINETELSRRLKKRKLSLSLLTPGHIEYKLDPGRREWFLNSLEGSTEKINRDFKPLGVFFSLSYWNAMFSPYMRGLFRWFERVNLRSFFILFSFAVILFLAVRLKFKRVSQVSIPLCITTTGFAGMLFDLTLIFAFQTLYGYLFHWLGLLVTAFMAGTAAGSLKMTLDLGRIRNPFFSFIKLELALIVFSATLPVIFFILSPYVNHPGVSLLLRFIFLALSFLSGVIVGAQFPLAGKIHLGGSPDLSRTAGLLYGADLFGGWLGGLIGGVILLPVLGLAGTCMVAVMVKVSSLIILSTSGRRLK